MARPRLPAPKRRQHGHRRDRDLADDGAKGRQCIVDPIQHRRRGAAGAGLARTLGAEQRLRGRRGDVREQIVAQRERRLLRRLAADPGAARAPGAAAIGGIVGIAEDHADGFGPDAERAGEDLRRYRLGALVLLGDARPEDDAAAASSRTAAASPVGRAWAAG
jgi:hypothetical protein